MKILSRLDFTDTWMEYPTVQLFKILDRDINPIKKESIVMNISRNSLVVRNKLVTIRYYTVQSAIDRLQELKVAKNTKHSKNPEKIKLYTDLIKLLKTKYK